MPSVRKNITQTNQGRKPLKLNDMAQCRACGGILGRDCFNEQDCMSISNSNDYDFELMDYKIQVLISELEKHNIPIPELTPPPRDFSYLWDNNEIL